ncbi:hypothetical protein Gocc_2990 [Gaiella occulta]|uniref:Uncharacterized protein n=1 Tax=Gaiella occulta TaxID=1002870 RepID=A0A7M2YUH2_9ACTN|nr:hypothetical protein [Gaiella occulta]RDI73390.1 hypothetical protein Gocc_2990 [Gaiella occulta]
MTVEYERDEQLGAALRELDLPPLPADFYPLLRRRLDAERAARAARRRVVLAAAALLLAGSAAAAVLLALPARAPLAPSEALAGRVKVRVIAAFGSAQTLRARLVTAIPGPDGTRTSISATVVLSARGDYRWSERVPTRRGAPPERNESSFDAAAGVGRSFSAGGEFKRPSGEEYQGLAAGSPDAYNESPFLGQLRAVVRSVREEGRLRVREVRIGGRPAWRVALPLTRYLAGNPGGVSPSLSPDRLIVVIDRESGFPLRIVEQRRGRVLSETRVLSLRLDEPVAPGTFRLHYPPGTELRRREDVGFRRLPLSRAGSVVGYRPLVPGWLPAGFRLAQVSVARGTLPTALGANPPSRGVVSLVYRHGFEQLIVTTRARTRGGWHDPFASPWLRFRPRRLTLQEGALAGARAELVVDGRTTPHLWALGTHLVITVAGDATPAELVRVASSLHPR